MTTIVSSVLRYGFKLRLCAHACTEGLGDGVDAASLKVDLDNDAATWQQSPWVAIYWQARDILHREPSGKNGAFGLRRDTLAYKLSQLLTECARIDHDRRRRQPVEPINRDLNAPAPRGRYSKPPDIPFHMKLRELIAAIREAKGDGDPLVRQIRRVERLQAVKRLI